MDMQEKIDEDFSFGANFEFDDAYGPPWEECDGHGVVSAWTTRAKKPSERILVRDPHSRRYYDVQASMKQAREQGWNAPPYTGTRGECAARAVERDFEYLRAWCNDEWHYYVVKVALFYRGRVVATDTVGAVEDYNDYHHEQAREMAQGLVRLYRRELAERQVWEARGVMTIGELA